MTKQRKAKPFKGFTVPGTSIHLRVNRFGKIEALYRELSVTGAEKQRTASLAREGITTKLEAEEWARRKQAELDKAEDRIKRQGFRRGAASPWPEIVDAYEKHFMAQRKVRKPIQPDHLKRWLTFLAASGVKTGEHLKPKHLAGYRDFLAEGQGKRKALAPASRNRHMNTIRAMLNWAAFDAELIDLSSDEISRKLRAYKVPKPAPVALKRDQLSRLIRACVENDSARHFAGRDAKERYWTGEANPNAERKHRELAPFVFLALLTGCRPGELWGMRWEDVDLTHGRKITLHRTKTDAARSVPLHDSPLAIELLTRLKLRSRGAKHVLGDNRTGGPRTLKATSPAWRRLLRLAGLDADAGDDRSYPPKVLRSTTISYVASVGSAETESNLTDRFGHDVATSRKHYRTPLHGLESTSATVEGWLGIEGELRAAMVELGLASEAKEAQSEHPLRSLREGS